MLQYIHPLGSKGSLSSSKEYLQMLLVFATTFLSITYLMNSLLKYRRETKRRALLVDIFPGPKKYPLLGNIPQVCKLVANPKRDVLDWTKYMVETYGGICRYWMFYQPKLIIGCGETAAYLYSNELLQGKASEVTNAARAIGGQGLLALPAHVHSQRRRLWMPSFSRKQIENSMKFFRQEAMKLRDELEQFASENDEPPIFEFMERSVGCTFRAISYTAFGEEYMNKLPAAVGREHMHDLHTISVNMTSRTFRPWLVNDLTYFHGTGEGRETLKCIERGNMLTKNAITARRKERLAQGIMQKHVVDRSGNNILPPLASVIDTGVTCFIDHMLNIRDAGYLTEEELIDELNVFIAAGYDTSGIGISYVLYLLSLHPEHQEKVADELFQLLQEANVKSTDEMKNFMVTSADTKKMKYLELCIKETLRLYPVLPISPRRTAKDVQLPDGRIIPEGVDVYVLLDYIHRDPKIFPDPDNFLPERHLNSHATFMPFTIGSRNCIGQVYAMYEMKVILSYLLMSYKWETTEQPGLKPIFQTLQVPENGMHFKISKRQFSFQS